MDNLTTDQNNHELMKVIAEAEQVNKEAKKYLSLVASDDIKSMLRDADSAIEESKREMVKSYDNRIRQLKVKEMELKIEKLSQELKERKLDKETVLRGRTDTKGWGFVDDGVGLTYSFTTRTGERFLTFHPNRKTPTVDSASLTTMKAIDSFLTKGYKQENNFAEVKISREDFFIYLKGRGINVDKKRLDNSINSLQQKIKGLRLSDEFSIEFLSTEKKYLIHLANYQQK